MRFALWRAVIAALAVACFLPAARADEYPSRPIRVIIGTPPGSVGDTYVRLYAQHLAAALKQPIVVDNRPGASGTIAAEAVARAAPDGYTLLYGAQTDMATLAAVGATLRYDPARNFTPVAIATLGYPLLLVNPALGIRSVADLVAYGKRNPDQLACGAAGHATSYHFGCAYVAQLTGTPIRVIQYKGSPQATMDTASGQIQLTVAYTSEVEQQFVIPGKLLPLAVLAPSRIAKFPSVPTLAEAGYPGGEIPGWNGFFLPAGAPPPLVARLNAEIAKASQQPDIAERLRNAGGSTPPMSAAEFGEFVRRERDRWQKMSVETGIRAAE